MNEKSYFSQYYTRLMWEAIIKSLICGFIIGFLANFLMAFFFWAFDVKGFWWSIVAGVGIGALSALVFYFKRFQPTTKMIARRIDRLGLEERLITMTELEKDESYIALRQREDAKEKLQQVQTRAIQLKIPTAIIVICSVAFALGASMTTIAALSEAGIIKKGSEIIDDVLPDSPVEYITVSYLIDAAGGGYVEGEAEQIIEKGADATTVIAVPDDGFGFYQWSDGVKDPVRTDANILDNFEVYAQFLPIGEAGEGEGEGKPGEGEPDPDSEPQRKNENADKPSERPQDGATGKYEESNQIKDGKTYYRDEYEVYYQYAMELIAAGQDIPTELRKFIETYMGILL